MTTNVNAKPSIVNEISGAYVRHPGRRRAEEPNAGRGVGPAPNALSAKEKRVWDELVSNCAPGVFQSSDRATLESLCVLLAAFRNDRAGFPAGRLMVLTQLMSRCGMDPISRTKVVAPRVKEEKPKSGLASFRN